MQARWPAGATVTKVYEGCYKQNVAEVNHNPSILTYADSSQMAWSIFCDPKAVTSGFGWPFKLGLRPLGDDQWPIRDSDYESQIALKRRLFAETPHQVWQAEDGFELAQREAYALVLKQPAPQTATQTLRLAGNLVQEDLVIMAPSPHGHRLVVGHVCFPTHWDLRTKIGKPMAQVHAPVPSFQAGTPTAAMIERMFTHLRADKPMQRANWSVSRDPQLPQPLVPSETINVLQDWAELSLRMERQTLHRLPVSGCILFTIRIFIQPLSALARHADTNQWQGFLQQLDSLTPAQRQYKGYVV